MNFKKLSLMLLAISISGTTAQATDNPAQGIPFIHLQREKHGAERIWSRTPSTVKQVCLKTIDNEFRSIVKLENDINQVPSINAIIRNTRIFGGLAGLATGLYTCTKVFADASPQNRILGTLATAATSAAFVYHVSRSFFILQSGIPSYKLLRNEAILNEHCTYLPTLADKLPANKKQQFMKMATPLNKKNQKKYTRTFQTYQNMLKAFRADN